MAYFEEGWRMKYYISEIDRTVELDDELVNEYCKYNVLRESMFLVDIYMQFGEIPTKDELSDEELSKMCNEHLDVDIKTLKLLPLALAFIEDHREEWHRMAVNGECVEIDLKDNQ
jgi:hypothetical protein